MSSPSKLLLLRHAADRRTLFWSLGLFPTLAVWAVYAPHFALYLVPLSLYLGFCAGVLAHYHNHRGVFRRDGLNQLYAVWLSVFYGFPLFGWIPTHNQNHHKFVNGPRDVTRINRDGKRDTLWNAVTYPMRSSAWQLPLVTAYFRHVWRRGRSHRYWLLGQILAVPLAHGLMAATCVHIHGWHQGGVAYGILVLLPSLFASWSMMFINYMQHVGCDPDSPHGHSRDFVGSLQNWFVFDAGLHTVHHEHPGLHWSNYRARHARRQHAIEPHLCEPNVFAFLWRRYGRQPLESIRSRAGVPESTTSESRRQRAYKLAHSLNRQHAMQSPSGAAERCLTRSSAMPPVRR